MLWSVGEFFFFFFFFFFLVIESALTSIPLLNPYQSLIENIVARYSSLKFIIGDCCFHLKYFKRSIFGDVKCSLPAVIPNTSEPVLVFSLGLQSSMHLIPRSEIVPVQASKRPLAASLVILFSILPSRAR